MNKRKFAAAIGVCCGVSFMANAGYIQIKAELAQVLIAFAFDSKERKLDPKKPWPWADAKVLAKIQIGQHINYVLSHASMRNLAFGPAHMSQTPLPGELGNSVIVGHRDTHFYHLENVSIGDIIEIDNGTTLSSYIVTELMIVDKSQVEVMDNMHSSALTLITCYPFNGVSTNPDQRFVVRAVKDA